MADGLGKVLQGAAAKGVAGMAALPSGTDSQIGVALFRQVNATGFDAGRTENSPVLNIAAALIQQELQLHAPAFQKLCHGQGAGVEGLLILTEGQVYIPCRTPALAQQILRRLQFGKDLVLDVQRAPAPDIALGNGAGEGRIGPVAFRAGLHAHHVHMGHEEDGLLALVTAVDMDQQAAAHHLGGGGGHHSGERIHDELPELGKLPVGGAVIDGAAGDGGGEPLAGGVAVQLGIVPLVAVKTLIIGHLSSR